MKYLALLTALTVVVIIPNKQVPKIVKPIALVKYQDTVYQCEEVVSTICGYTIDCGDLSVYCVDDIEIEYLR